MALAGHLIENKRVEACPGCHSSRIYRRLTMAPDYRCQDCAREFDDPIEREAGERTVRACPECNTSAIHRRLTLEPDFRCSHCGLEFDRPVERRPGEGPSPGAKPRRQRTVPPPADDVLENLE